MPTIRRTASSETRLWEISASSEWHVAVIVYSADEFSPQPEDIAEMVRDHWESDDEDTTIHVAASSEDPVPLSELHRLLGRLMEDSQGVTRRTSSPPRHFDPVPDAEEDIAVQEEAAPVRARWAWSWDEPTPRAEPNAPGLPSAMRPRGERLTDGISDATIRSPVEVGLRLRTVAQRERWTQMEHEGGRAALARVRSARTTFDEAIAGQNAGTGNTVTSYSFRAQNTGGSS